MDEALASILTVAVPLGPLLAALAMLGGALRRGTVPSTWPVVAGAAACGVFSGLAVVLMAAGRWPAGHGVVLFAWLALDASGLQAPLALRADPLGAAAAAFLSVSIAAVIAGARHHRRETAVLAALVLLAATLTLFATNLLAWLVFWELTTVACYLLIDAPARDRQAPAVARRMLLVQWAGDVLLVFGIATIWSWLGTLEFSEIPERVRRLLDPGLAEDVLRQNRAVLAVIAACLFGGAAARCAQFPLFGWLNDLAARPPEVVALALAGMMPAGLVLVVRCGAVFDAAAEIRLLVTLLGAMTALIAAAVAVTGLSPRHVLAYLAAALSGWGFVGLGGGQPGGVEGAIVLLAAQLLAGTALWLDVGRASWIDTSAPRRMPSTAGLLGGLILVSGFWGQQAILSGFWDAAGAVRDEADPSAGSSATALVVVALGLASQFLIAFAVFRAWLRAAQSQEGRGAAPPAARARPPIAAWLLVLAALGLGFLEAGPWPGVATLVTGRTPAERDPLLTAASVLCALVGTAAGWGLYSHPSPWPERIAARLGPFTRLSRHRVYVDEMASFGVALPLRALAQACRLFDRWALDALLARLPAGLARLPTALTEPLRDATVQFHALAVLLGTAVLLLALLAS